MTEATILMCLVGLVAGVFIGHQIGWGKGYSDGCAEERRRWQNIFVMLPRQGGKSLAASRFKEQFGNGKPD